MESANAIIGTLGVRVQTLGRSRTWLAREHEHRRKAAATLPYAVRSRQPPRLGLSAAAMRAAYPAESSAEE
jgi:hypothetical protein